MKSILVILFTLLVSSVVMAQDFDLQFCNKINSSKARFLVSGSNFQYAAMNVVGELTVSASGKITSQEMDEEDRDGNGDIVSSEIGSEITMIRGIEFNVVAPELSLSFNKFMLFIDDQKNVHLLQYVFVNQAGGFYNYLGSTAACLK